jgi:hypothetical protein
VLSLPTLSTDSARPLGGPGRVCDAGLGARHEERAMKRRRKKRSKLKAPALQKALSANLAYNKLAKIPLGKKTDAQVLRQTKVFKEWYRARKVVAKEGLEGEYKKHAKKTVFGGP